MSFTNWPMLQKVFSVLLLIAVAGFGGLFHTAHRIEVVDGRDTAIIEGPDPAILASARADRMVVGFEASLSGNIAAVTDESRAMARRHGEEVLAGHAEQIAHNLAATAEETSRRARAVVAAEQAAAGTHRVTGNISGIGRAAETTGSASTQSMALCDGLSVRAGDLGRMVETFVGDFAAA
jgi:hypothetical protein